MRRISNYLPNVGDPAPGSTESEESRDEHRHLLDRLRRPPTPTPLILAASETIACDTSLVGWVSLGPFKLEGHGAIIHTFHVHSCPHLTRSL